MKYKDDNNLRDLISVYEILLKLSDDSQQKLNDHFKLCDNEDARAIIGIIKINQIRIYDTAENY